MTYAIEVNNLNKIYDDFELKDVCFKLETGTIMGIVGENGAGKSTLLKMITGVVTPTAGKITLNGKVSSLLELGTAFNPELTGIANIYQHGQVMGLTNEEIKAKEQEIIDFADIGDHLYQPVKTYSSGMFARLAFACAINVDPDILIVDEVLSVGDMAFQLKCFKKFEQFKKQGKTILFVTHSITDILRNCTRTIIIDSGKKIFDGDVKEGVERYKKIIVGLDPKQSKEGLLSDNELLKKNPNYKKIQATENEGLLHFSSVQQLLLFSLSVRGSRLFQNAPAVHQIRIIHNKSVSRILPPGIVVFQHQVIAQLSSIFEF